MNKNYQPRTLPQSLHSNFKSIFKLIESKQYRRALRAAEGILKEQPFHGETLSLKGLVLYSMNKKKDAYNFARKGLTYDVKSFVCWQVMALFHRGEQDYYDAAKCFENSIILQNKNEESQRLFKDLMVMHVQNRNYEDHLKCREKLLQQDSGSSENWLGCAVAAHLAGDLDRATDVVTGYIQVERSQREKSNKIAKKSQAELNEAAFSLSELLLYKVSLLEQKGQYEKALKFLDDSSKEIVDKEELKIKRCEYLLKLEKYEEAEAQYRILIKGNLDNFNYYEGLLKAMKLIPLETKDAIWNPPTLTPEEKEKILDVLNKLAKDFPRSPSIKQISLSFAIGSDFKNRIKTYLSTSLSKGVQSLLATVKHLYKDKEKANTINEVIIEIETQLNKINKLDQNDTLEEPPTTILWTNYYLAQHYNFLNQHTKALQYLEKCKNHTPTVLDFDVEMAKVYKAAGDPQLALKYMNEARSLDLADRYLNSKTTRYCLKADQLTQARDTFSLFSKSDDDPTGSSSIFEMQVMWYEIEEGRSWIRQNKLGRALKILTDVEKHFLDFYGDQLDFHQFCLRRNTLRQYVKFLKMEDNINGLRHYFLAACEIVKCYLSLYDSEVAKAEKEKNEYAELSEEDKKKLIAKKKREENKKKRKEDENVQQSNQNKKKGAVVEFDPEGLTFTSVSNPLKEANKRIRLLNSFNSQKLETHLLSFEVSFRRQKYLLALKAVNKGLEISPNDPQVHFNVVKLFHTVSNLLQNFAGPVKDVFLQEREAILKGKSLEDYNEEYHKVHKGTVKERRFYGEAYLLLNPSKKDQIISVLTDIRAEDTLTNPLQDCIEVHRRLIELNPESAKVYYEKCKEILNHSRYFSPKELEKNPSDNNQNKPIQTEPL